jgi:hypothetical protein
LGPPPRARIGRTRGLCDLPLPDPKPSGAEWIEVYRARLGPSKRDPGLAEGTGGFGMHLLARLAAHTTVRTHRDGKTVTVTLDIPT